MASSEAGYSQEFFIIHKVINKVINNLKRNISKYYAKSLIIQQSDADSYQQP